MATAAYPRLMGRTWVPSAALGWVLIELGGVVLVGAVVAWSRPATFIAALLLEFGMLFLLYRADEP